MPRFEIDHASYYDWDVLDEDELDNLTENDQVRSLASGDVAKRTQRHVSSTTTVGIPESEVEDLMLHFERTGQTKSRNQVIGWYLEEKTIPSHTLMDHVTAIRGDDEEVVEYLKRRFDVPSLTASGGFGDRPISSRDFITHRHWTSLFHTQVHRNGALIHDSLRRNLRTTAADWRSGLDWQSKIMGGDAALGAAATGTNTTAPTATTITLNGASAPGSTSAWNGHIVIRGSTFGVIMSNTNVASPVLTIDQWYDPTNLGGAAATTPAAGTWIIMPGNFHAAWLALTTDAVAPAASDVTLTSEITTGGGARALGTYSHTSGATSFQWQKVFNFTATFTINKEAVFASAVQTAGGAMPFESAEPNPPTVVNGDQLTQTVTCNI